jgi:hypothetical protein
LCTEVIFYISASSQSITVQNSIKATFASGTAEGLVGVTIFPI